MFHPLECFIGLRYVRSRRRRGVVSFMTAASMLGIALGVAALIVILSVMNGLETEIRNRLLSMSAHARVWEPSAAGIVEWPALGSRLAAAPEVQGVAPYVMLEGMLQRGPNLRPALVRGVVPDEERAVTDVDRFLHIGSLDDLVPGGRRILLGQAIAFGLGVTVGDRVDFLVLRAEPGRVPVPQLASFTVVGLFEAGLQDHDGQLALVHMSDAAVLKGLRNGAEGGAEGLAVRLHDPLAASRFRARSAAWLDEGLRYTDWTEEHRSHFRAIRIEKTMMTVILLSIVGVAAFNIVASLMMVVTDKEKDIAILRTYGMEPGRVARVFLVQGALIGLAGTLLGTGLGLVLAFNVETIVPWLERTFRFQIMPGDVYYVTEIPAEIQALDVGLVATLAFILAAIATVYPSRRAAAVAPAEALRYE